MRLFCCLKTEIPILIESILLTIWVIAAARLRPVRRWLSAISLVRMKTPLIIKVLYAYCIIVIVSVVFLLTGCTTPEPNNMEGFPTFPETSVWNPPL